MLRRPTIWITVALLCAVGALCLWQRGQRLSAPVSVSVPGANQRPAATFAPASAPLLPLLSSANATSTAARADQHSGYILSNTTTPLNQLLRRDSALLLENANIDSAEQLDLNIPAHLRAQGDPGSFIVQARGPVTEAFRARLREAGVTLVSYIPNNAWLVRGSEAQVASLAGQPEVQATLAFEPYYKIKPSLLPLAVEQKPLPAGQYLNLVLFADAQADTMKALASLGATVISEGPSPFGPVVTIQPARKSLAALAGLPGVQIIGRAAPRVLANDLARVKMGVSLDTLVPDNYFGLTGTNVLVALTDSGVDTTHPDLVGRVFTNSFLAGLDTAGHGTHVAGIIAGDGTASDTVSNAPSGSEVGANFRGKAPAASLYSLFLGESLAAGLDSDAYAQEQTALTNALISNNSWVLGGEYDYDITAASYDAATRDALPGEMGSQPVLFVFAAGGVGGANEQGLSGIAGSILSPGTAKNVITVGALEQARDITNEVYYPPSTNRIAVWAAGTDSDNQVAGYSSRGNVGPGIEGEFGRFKPDVVAPGTFVASAQSKDWDTNAYYSITNVVRNTFQNQLLKPAALNQYSINVNEIINGLVRSYPISLQIFATPVGDSAGVVTDLPIYVKVGDSPTTNDVPLGTNVVSLPPDLPLTPGTGYFYAVGNPTNINVRFNVTTEITYTNNLGVYYSVLRQMNDDLGPNYRYESGTSMSAAAVSGMLALMQEFFERHMGITNSPALMKAMLINGARSASTLYNYQVKNTINHQGWGLANLPTSLPTTTNVTAITNSSFVFFDQDPTNALATGDSRTRLVTLNDSAQGQRLRFTLVWTDPPGNPAAGVKLVNDLDLVVTNLDTGDVYCGNNITSGDFTSATPTNGTPNPDVINNVENVFLSEPHGTNLSVTVIGRRVNVNAVTAHTNNVVQDYALVMSSEGTDAMSVTEQPVVAAGTPYVTTLTNSLAVVPLLNQTVGANSPLILGTNGVTNQWHFYVLTNYGTNVNFTNAAFITFLPPTLAVPRMGPRASIADEISRPEADIDMFVSQNAALTNLDAAALAAADRSVGRGGTEIITYTDSAPGEVYYVGIKSEDQMAGQYGFLGLFSDVPFSERDSEGNLIVRGLPVPANIPDGTPDRPGAVLVFGIATEPIKVRRVIVTNTLTHELFGDLLGNLSHNNGFAVLNNHSFGNGDLTQMFVYDDSKQGDVIDSKTSDGPGSLQDFVGQEGIGLWLLTMLDDAPTHTGRVENLTIKIEPQQIEAGDTFTIEPGGWGYTFVEVPAEATNLTINLVNSSASPGPVDLYVRRGDFPTFTEYDKKATINPPGGSLSISKYDLPPLQAGTYYIGVFNPNVTAQTVTVSAHLDLDLAGVVPVVFTSTNMVPLIDDAVTRDQIVVTNDQRIISTEVGLRINHPRVSDLAIQLISPKGKRVMLFENRGGADTNGLGRGNPDSLNLISNGGFEMGLAGWTITPGISIYQAVGYLAPSEGTNFCVIGDLDIPNSRVSQTFPVLPGTTYTLTFDRSGWGDPGRVSSLNVAVSVPPGVVLVSTNYTKPILDRNPMIYVTESIDFTIPPGASNATVAFSDLLDGIAVGTALDRVSVTDPSSLVTYLTFTEDTNKTTTPIKFAIPPFTGGGTTTNITLSDFDTVTPGDYLAASTVDGWNVISNQVSVVNDAGTAQGGSNYLALASGVISNTLATVPGRQYTLTYSYRGPGAVSWWRGEGNAADAMGGNYGSLRNGAAFAAGEVGTGFLLDGVNDYVLVNPGTGLDVGVGSGFTVEGWINPTALTPMAIVEYERTLGSFNSADVGVHFYSSAGGTGTLYANVKDTAGGDHVVTSVPGLVTSGAWQHVALSYDKLSGVCAMYLNGVSVLQMNLGSFAPQTTFTNLLIGARTYFSSAANPREAFSGGMDEISLYSRALSGSELKAIHSRGGTGKFDAGVYATSPASSLAEATITAAGNTTTLIGSNTNWQTQTVTFIATQAATPVEITGIQPGMLLDSFTLTEEPAPLYYLPEEDSLAAFKGDNAKGTWTLEVWDSRVGATNPAPELLSWDLSFIFENNVALPVVLQPGVTVTNAVPPNGIQTLAVDVPAWATAATNSLLSADLPLLVWFNQDGAPTGVNPPDTLFYGGAATTGIETLTTGGTPPLVPGQRYYIGIQNTNLVPVTYSFRVDFDITALFNGVPYTSAMTSNDIQRYFSYDVSSNATAVSFVLTNLDGDLNLVASRAPQLPDLTTHELGSFNGGTSDEQILVFTNGTPVALTPGLWYLGVFKATSGIVNYTIEATEYTNTFPGIVTLTNAVPYGVVTSTNAPGSLDYYRYVVSSTAARVQFEIFGATDDYTLVARKGLPLPDLATFDYLSGNPGTNDELIVVFTNSAPVTLTSGDWFLAAVKNTAGTADYSIMATEWSQTGQPITITNIDTSWGDFCFTWNSLPGVHYIVESTPTLAPPTWTDVSGTITAFDYTTTWCTNITGTMQFFRVVEGISAGASPAASVSITSIVVNPDGVTLTWSGPVSASFHVQWTDTLSPAAWNTVATPITSTNGTFTFTDDGTQTAPLGPVRFYRLVQP